MILGIDATTEILHLALLDQGSAWTRWERVGIGKSHSAALLPSIESLLEAHGRTPADLTGVAACIGPGGFTSLRIGVATAEGLALAGLPTWGFSAFELRAMALGSAHIVPPFWILLDGQRGEVFHQRWTSDGPATPGEKHPLDAMPALLEGEPWWCPEACQARLETVLGPRPVHLPDEGRAMLEGLTRILMDIPSRPPEAPLVPFYIRETDAEVNFPEASTHLHPALRRGLAR